MGTSVPHLVGIFKASIASGEERFQFLHLGPVLQLRIQGVDVVLVSFPLLELAQLDQDRRKVISSDDASSPLVGQLGRGLEDRFSVLQWGSFSLSVDERQSKILPDASDELTSHVLHGGILVFSQFTPSLCRFPQSLSAKNATMNLPEEQIGMHIHLSGPVPSK